MMTLGTKAAAPQQIPICDFDRDSDDDFLNWLGSKNSVSFETCEAKADEHFAAAKKQGLLPRRDRGVHITLMCSESELYPRIQPLLPHFLWLTFSRSAYPWRVAGLKIKSDQKGIGFFIFILLWRESDGGAKRRTNPDSLKGVFTNRRPAATRIPNFFI